MRLTIRGASEPALLVAILALAAYLRLANLIDNPGWYTDEATHLDIARHLIAGRVQYLAITQSTLLFAKLPLFDLLLAAVGGGMLRLRILTGMLGVISVGVLYGSVRRITADARLGLTAALILAILPQAVLYSRFGFSYNLLAPLVIITILGLHEAMRLDQQRWLALAALAVGIGALSDLLMLVFAVPVLVVGAMRQPRSIIGSAIIMAVPIVLYSMVILITVPSAFWFDLRFTLFRVSSLPVNAQIETLSRNFMTLLNQDMWFIAALIGLVMLRPARFRILALLMLMVPIAAIGRTAALYSLSAYYMIPMLPLIALGVGSLLRYGLPTAVSRLHESLDYRWAAVVLAAVLGGGPLVLSVMDTLRSVQSGFHTPIDAFLISGSDARAAADYINEHAETDDLVIASPAVAWLIEANVADFQMAAAAEGLATPHLPADIPAERYAFDPRFKGTRFVVIDNLWRNWAVIHVPEAQSMLERAERWQRVFHAGSIEVYENPALTQ